MSKPIRVAHIVGKMVGGGVEAVVMNYFRHIDRDQVQFDFIIDSDSTVVPEDEIRDLGGRLFVVPPYQHLGEYQKAIGALFEEYQWGIVHSHINTLSVFPLRIAKITGVPVRIAHSHATMGKGETKRNILKLALRPFANVYPTDRVACSSYAGKWLFGDRASFTVIPNAVNITKFSYSKAARKEMRSEWGADDNCCVIGNLGRLETTKNQSILIDVFARLHAEHPASLLVIAGCGSLRGELERQAHELGVSDCVRFLGQVDDVSDLYQGMDVFSLPSLYEGFGMALLEAQVSGLPCVVSNRVSSEVVLSEKCKIVPLEDGADSWANAIWSQYSSCSDRVVRPEVFDRFDIEDAAKSLGFFYHRLDERSGR